MLKSHPYKTFNLLNILYRNQDLQVSGMDTDSSILKSNKYKYVSQSFLEKI